MDLLNNLIGKIKSKNFRTLILNYISLLIINGATFFLPLITLPYLTRVLGSEVYGQFAIGISTIAFIQIFVDYGFNLSATQDVSIYRDQPQKVKKIFNSVILIKILIALIILVIIIILAFFSNILGSDVQISIILYGIIIGSILLPTWLFLGMENMKYITILNISGYIFYIVMILTFVQSADDLISLLIFRSIFPVIVGAFSIFVVYKKYRIAFSFPSKHDIIEQIKHGGIIFASTVVISIYTSMNPLLLAFFSENDSIVAYFVVANSIAGASKSLVTGTISQTIYPRINKLIQDSKTRAIKFIKYSFLLIFAISTLLAIGLYIFSDLIVLIVAGEGFIETSNVLRLLSVAVVITSISNVFGYQILIPFGKKKQLTYILSFATIIHISVALVFVPAFLHLGIVYSILITETFVTISQFIYIIKEKILFSRVAKQID